MEFCGMKREIDRKCLMPSRLTAVNSPHMTPGAGIEPGPHWWKASALTTTPTLLPWKKHIENTIMAKFEAPGIKE